MMPEEAHRAARLKFGGPTQLRESQHEQRGLPQIERLLQDLRYGWRTLAMSRGFTAVVVATLALGIGANTTIFSVVNTLFLKPLPYPEPERLVNLWQSRVQQPDNLNILSAPNFLDWQRMNHVFERMALFDSAGRGYNLGGEKEPERVRGLRVSASLFPLLGVQPYLGRSFTADEEILGKDRVVILSYGLWQRRYGSDPALAGKTVRIDGKGYTVAGVMPPGFEFSFFSGHNELWVPVGFDAGDRGRDSNSFGACARLKKGVTLAQARAEMDSIGRSLAQQYPQSNAGGTVAVTPMSELGVRYLRPTFIALFAAVGFVLLIACVNVANMMLARGATRRKEFAVRRALGAGRLRIVRQLLTESLMLSVLGGGAGLLVAAGGARLVESVLPDSLRFVPFRHLDRIEWDSRVFAFTFLVGCLAGLLFGLASALSALRTDVQGSLQEGRSRGTSARGGRLRHVLVAAEVALALGVLTGAGLMVESMSRLLRVDPGLNPKNVLTLSVSLPQTVLYYSPPVRQSFCRDLAERVGTIPGVVSASSVSHLPIGGGNAGRGFSIEGQPEAGREGGPGGLYAVACPDYFRSMGIPLLEGREFSHQDTVTAPGVVIINQAMARRYWRNQDPLGTRIKIGRLDSRAPWLTVVGVIGDVRHNGLDRSIQPELYRPYTQAAWPFMTVVVRTASAPGAFATAVKRGLLAIDPDQAASGVATMEEVVRGSMGPRRLPTVLLAAFGILALTLAAVGISGVVGYSVVQRTHEIGIRMALGARPTEVLGLVMRRSMGWTLAGVGVGIAASFSLTRLLSGLLFGVGPMDPQVLGAAAVLVTGVALLASYVPARHATKVDPIAALRCE
jgi:putative ABC transport system permease protein